MGFQRDVVIAVGAILRFAVSVTTTGFNLHTIGLILMIVGVVQPPPPNPPQEFQRR